MADDLSRRTFLLGAAAGAGALAAACGPARSFASLNGGTAARRPQFPGQPGDRPNPRLPEGVDLLPQIEHIVIYMQENHSYDSYFGMLPRGDGFRVKHGVPTNANPDPTGQLVRVFHAQETCQPGRGVSQSWNATRTQIDGGRMDGFLADGNLNAMKYWDGSDLPFYYSLASTFPVCDRWFASAPAQTYPNRMYLQAATSQQLISTSADFLTMPHPAGGTIWEKLSAFGISWFDYAWDLPDIGLFPKVFNANRDKVRTFTQFLADCHAGTLPSVSIVSPGVVKYTEENPADIQLGEAYTASIVNALMHGPAWPKTALFFVYDEHGGYYDHVAPPAAVPPDDILPAAPPVNGVPPAWDHYGLRVPAVVISPFARRHYVSHVVHDHTSVLRFIETKFNLGALTRRDANASNLMDCFQFHNAPFLEPPTLAVPGLPAAGSTCTPNIPPPPTAVAVSA
jgi:phospholipase C